MSLTTYLKEHAPIREAFMALHNAELRKIKPTPLLVPRKSNDYRLVGTAFDYLARIELARRLAGAVEIHEGPWIAERGAEHVERFCRTKAQGRQWRKILLGARDEIKGLGMSPDALPRIVELAQYLAHADCLHRRREAFDPDFKAIPDVGAELIGLHRAFQVATGFEPENTCILNPDFPRGRELGGADGDLILDTTLIDIKVVDSMAATVEAVIQLAGYAVLQKLGGTDLGKKRYKPPFTLIGIYFGRHGQLVTWSLAELFPAGNFDEFAKRFVGEIPEWKASYGFQGG